MSKFALVKSGMLVCLGYPVRKACRPDTERRNHQHSFRCTKRPSEGGSVLQRALGD